MGKRKRGADQHHNSNDPPASSGTFFLIFLFVKFVCPVLFGFRENVEN